MGEQKRKETAKRIYFRKTKLQVDVHWSHTYRFRIYPYGWWWF